MLKKIIVVSLLFVGSLYAGSINIALAANVSYAINELKSEFHKMHPDIDVEVTLGSSGKLTAQIKNGAPYDIFMAANMKYPEALYKDGFATSKPTIYAQGSLAILSNTKKDFTQGIKLVEDKKIKTIAIANPQTAPYGKAAIEALKNAGLYEKVKNKFVNAESISQTVAYTVTATDVGFIAKSSLYSPKMKRFKEDVNFKDVDAKLYTPIKQGIIILKKAKENKDATAFYDFILSKKAKEIFKRYGYIVNE
jgi:molybdate transport system substrate-binding protein